MKNAARDLGLLAIAFLLFVLVTALTARQLDLPEVQVSNSTGQCVKVLDPAAEYEGRRSEWSCANLPEKYTRTWVR